MKRQLSHRGFTVLEAIASIFIITLALTTGIMITINVRNQTIATNERILAVEVGSRIRDDIVNNTTYTELENWMNDQEVIVNSINCSSLATPFSCDVFTYISNGKTYDTNVVITFLVPSTESTLYQVVHFEITIEYYSNRYLTMDGIVYE
ncbi:MAG: hypothetical protein JXC31_04915 [Acholeplasmataceae bacterium]|nr:hypothetical protein [Acholeplasmataceae bacterium]